MNSYFKMIDTVRLDKKIKSGEFPFSQNLFWETAIARIEMQRHRRYIIERVLTRGMLEDFYIMTHIYSIEEIREVLRKSKELDPKTIQFCSRYFNIPKNEMNVSSFYHY